MTPAELARRLEVGTGPDREADARIQSLAEGSTLREIDAFRGRALVATMPGEAPHDYFAYWPETGECWPSTPHPSSDIGEGLALLLRHLPGARWMLAHNAGRKPAEAYVYVGATRHAAVSGDPARAFAAAIVRALAGIQPEPGSPAASLAPTGE